MNSALPVEALSFSKPAFFRSLFGRAAKNEKRFGLQRVRENRISQGDRSNLCGTREFLPGHWSDALYQGTTLVGPLRPIKDLG
jgi:hypothetical protein